MAIDRSRRRLLGSATALAGVSALGVWPARAAPSNRQKPEPFSFEGLVEHARALASRAYRPPQPRYPKLLDKLGYAAFMGIHPRQDRALWIDDDLDFTVEFFHLDQSARQSVAIYVVDRGQAQRLAYDPDLFRYDDPALAKRLPADLGFAGLRLLDRQQHNHEWLAFKGASYFRSPGALDQYGLSARGVAVDTGFGADESFPAFTAYWLFKPQPGERELTICTLLEGRHLAGAYRMRCRPESGVIMDIEARLFQRDPVRRLGIAPLTSMFWYDETNARRGIDWRPEIHDSDGLALATGDGERIWRALDNPPQTHYSAFLDHNPRGFGLLQRDRAFDHYQDSHVHYERRPSLWVEPRGDWGRGYVALLELATDEEVYDNINAFWVPHGPDGKGSADPDHAWRFDYRLYWCGEEPHPPIRARVVATRIGRAGEPGTYENQSVLARKFVVDFDGGALAGLGKDARIEIRARASHGGIVNPYAERVADTPRWRAIFDWSGELPPENEPVELHCFLTRSATRLTEIWTFAYFPQALPQRVAT